MFFLFPLLSSVVTGTIAALASASITSIITWSIVGGVLVAVLQETITRPKIREAAREKGIKGVFKTMVNNSTNTVSLKDLNSGAVRMRMKGDAIDSDIHDGDLITI